MKPISRLRTSLEASFWFIPALIVLLSVAAATALVEADSVRPWDPAAWSPRLFGAGADGSRAMLSAIGTSMITVAGVVFSITIVALETASGAAAKAGDAIVSVNGMAATNIEAVQAAA